MLKLIFFKSTISLSPPPFPLLLFPKSRSFFLDIYLFLLYGSTWPATPKSQNEVSSQGGPIWKGLH